MKSFGTSRDIQKCASTSAVRLKVPDNTVEKDPAYYLFITQQSSDLPSTQADFALLIYYQQRPLHQRNSPNLPSQNSTEMEQQMTPHYIKVVLAASLQYLQSAIYIFYSLMKKLLTVHRTWRCSQNRIDYHQARMSINYSPLGWTHPPCLTLCLSYTFPLTSIVVPKQNIPTNKQNETIMLVPKLICL